MTTLQWYKRYPLAYLDGTRRLSLEERGAYADLLELIMYHGGSVDDDCKYLAAEMHCDIRVWRRIRCRLLDAGKIHIEDGMIHNTDQDIAVVHDGASILTRGYSPYVRALYIEIKVNNDNICAYCGDKTGPFEVDHVIPISRGGTHDIGNLAISCRPCNRSKGSKTVEEWMQ